MATKKEREKVAEQVDAALAPGQGDDAPPATVSAEVVAGEATEAPAQVPAEEPAPAPLPHVDDRVSRPYVVHLATRIRAGRKVVKLKDADGRVFTFSRGKGGDLEHVMKLTPPQARQLRVEGWTVLARDTKE